MKKWEANCEFFSRISVFRHFLVQKLNRVLFISFSQRSRYYFTLKIVTLSFPVFCSKFDSFSQFSTKDKDFKLQTLSLKIQSFRKTVCQSSVNSVSVSFQ